MNPKILKIMLGCALASTVSVLCCRPTIVDAQVAGDDDEAVDATVDTSATGDTGGAVADPGTRGEDTIQGENLGLGWTRGWYTSPPGFDCTPTPTPTPPPARCGDSICQTDCEETPQNCPQDCGFCGDGECRDGEDLQSCADDCTVCGDNICSTNERLYGTCPGDCPVCGDGMCNPIAENQQSCPADCSQCGDGICSGSENVQTCPQDCAQCGDGICSAGENCPQDCAQCGDGTCNGDETLQTCPADCTVCNDGFCSVGESTDNCPNDCPPPTPTATPTPNPATPTPQPTPPILNCPPDRPLNCNQTLQICACGRCADNPFDVTCLGCFSPETKITMADGSKRSIASVRAGDLVWNPVTKQSVRVKYPTMGPEAIPMWKIGYDTTAVVVTEGHPMVVNNDRLESEWGALRGLFLRSSARTAPPLVLPATFSVKKAREVTVGDLILGADGQYHRVNLVQELPVKADQVVLNLMLDTDSTDERDHMISADGVITGDLYLQERLEKSASK